MSNSNISAMGLIFPNSYDKMVPELVLQRLMASIPFASRYRLIDFILSSMVNSGIDNITILVKKNYHSLMDHLGSGREWDLTRKNGGLTIMPPFADRESTHVYADRVEALAGILPFLREQKEEYAIISDCNMIANIDFKPILAKHVESGADVTMMYSSKLISDYDLQREPERGEFYYTLEVDGDKVEDIKVNSKAPGINQVSMNMYIIKRTKLISLIEEGYVRGKVYFERDILLDKLDELDIRGYEYTGYTALISNVKTYFSESMALLDEKNAKALFGDNNIYTKIRDDNPTRYTKDSKVSNVTAADGCVIEGHVENSILFRGVKIGKGAVVKNCILMQDTVVEAGANMEYVIADKDVLVTSGANVHGSDIFPMLIPKRKTV